VFAAVVLARDSKPGAPRTCFFRSHIKCRELEEIICKGDGDLGSGAGIGKRTT
jgi:hypothetical protein